MDANDQKKICLAGYTIIRKSDYPVPHIKCKTKENPDSWRKYGNTIYRSKSARDKEVKKLLENNKIIQD